MRISLSSQVAMVVNQKIEAMTPMPLLPFKTPIVVKQMSEVFQTMACYSSPHSKKSQYKKVVVRESKNVM